MYCSSFYSYTVLILLLFLLLILKLIVTSFRVRKMRSERHHFNINEDGRLNGFTWPDYVMFVGMLLFSLFIGFFYAYRDRKKANEEYLLGGRSMTCFPVSLSLVASYISAILVLGEGFVLLLTVLRECRHHHLLLLSSHPVPSPLVVQCDMIG